MDHIQLKNCATGYASSGAVAGQFSSFSLYNNSAVGALLAIRDLSIQAPSGGSLQAWTTAGMVGSVFSVGSPVVPTERAIPGQICTNATATSPGNFRTWGLGNPVGGGPLWLHDFPLVVLPPGFSFVVSAVSLNVAIVGALWWQALSIDQLDAEY